MWTYEDSVEHALDYLGTTHPGDSLLRDCKRAVLAAYSDVSRAKRWNYLLATLRIRTIGAVAGDGVASSVALSASTAVATLSGATWPAWTAGAWLQVGSVGYPMIALVDSTHAQVDPSYAPGLDVPAGSPYAMWRMTYALPPDFLELDDGVGESGRPGPRLGTPGGLLANGRSFDSVGDPLRYTVEADPLNPGRMMLRVWPAPAEGLTIDFPYRRAMRPLGGCYREAAGRVSVAQDSSGVTGSGTAFRLSLAGCVLRASLDPLKDPTGPSGQAPADHEALVVSVVSATSLLLSRPAPAAFTNARYTISDRVDINELTMGVLWQRAIERQAAINRVLKDRPSADALYRRELEVARDSDATSYAARVVGGGLAPAPWWMYKGDTSVFQGEG